MFVVLSFSLCCCLFLVYKRALNSVGPGSTGCAVCSELECLVLQEYLHLFIFVI